MKKILILSFLSIALWFSNSNCFAQRSFEMELLNLVQINETEFRFDVRFRNTAADPVTNWIAVEGMQFQVAFNTAILNGGGLNNTYLQYLTGTSDLVAPATSPITPVSSNVTSDQTKIQWVTQALGTDAYTMMIDHNNWVRIGTFKVILKAGSSSTNSKNFASVLPNLTLVSTGCLCNWCNVNYDVFGDGGYTRAASAAPNSITTKTLTNSTVNKPLYSHAYTGTGNYSDAIRWNNSVATTDASYHIVPTVTTNSISIGAFSTANPPVAVAGVLTITNNQTFKDLSIGSTSSLTLNAGTQLTVDNNLYNDNTTAGSLTLKADPTGVLPTASLKNSTPNVNATIECYLAGHGGVATTGYHFLSSPVNNQVIAPNFTATPATDYDFFAWNANPSVAILDSCWRNQKVAANNITNFTNGSGYLVSYANAGIHNFVGTINVSDFNPTINFFSGIYGSWALIGNPYACALQANLSSWSPSSTVNTTVYVLDGTTSTFKTWNGTTGNLTNGQIPSMQGFWISTSGASPSPSIIIPASAKTHSSNNLYKTTPLENHLVLNVQSPNTTKDVTFIYFKDENSNGVDANDGLLMRSWNPLNTQIFSYINNSEYVINALGSYTNPISVNVGFEPKVDGNFTITADDIQSFNSASHILLQDLKTNTTQDLRINPTYSFTASTTDAINRFKIVFDLALGINNTNAVANNIYSFENNIYIKTNTKISSVSVYNMLGQEVENIQQPTSDVLTLNQPSGYYTVRVVTNNTVYSQKVYIK